MNLFVPYDNSPLARIALREACRVMTPLDRITVMAAVIVPPSRDVAAPAGDIWKQTCRAEVHLAAARAYAERIAHSGDGLRCVRVQARSWVAAIIAGADHYRADTILLAERAGIGGHLAAFFGPTPAIIRHAPCAVRVLYTVAASEGGQGGRAVRRSETAAPQTPSIRSTA